MYLIDHFFVSFIELLENLFTKKHEDEDDDEFEDEFEDENTL